MHQPNPAYNMNWLNRRQLLRSAGAGAGLLAFSSLLGQEGLLADDVPGPAIDPDFPMAARQGHFPTKAKSVIWLFMNGGPSHIDTFDPKPELDRRDGQELEGFDPETGFFKDQVGPLMKSPFSFTQYGETGTPVSELFPYTAQHVDDMAMIHSMYSDSNNHGPALFKINSGIGRMGYPCMGSWISYGLGSENQNLPGFVVMYDPLDRGLPKNHSLNWGSGFLPSVYQGTALAPKGDPIRDLSRPGVMTDDEQRAQLDLLAELNGEYAQEHPGESELAARMESFELAYRMQVAAPEAIDINQETEETLQLYGLDRQSRNSFGKQCLVARRLVERGVRFVQIYSGGMSNDLSWDGHNDIVQNHGNFAAEVDQPIAGLLSDLKRRGLLEETLVIWGGEFGRLPIVQKGGTGRDHNPHAFTMWMAGGGVKAGARYGATDELGYQAVENRVNINDFHATVLHLMGLDHERLTYRYNGRDFRLTDVAGNVIHDVIG